MLECTMMAPSSSAVYSTCRYITSHHITSHHITLTLFYVQYIVLGEKWASVVVLSGSQGKGHEAVHLSSYSHSSVEVRSVLTQSLNEL